MDLTLLSLSITVFEFEFLSVSFSVSPVFLSLPPLSLCTSPCCSLYSACFLCCHLLRTTKGGGVDTEKAGYGSEKREEVNCVFKRMQFKAGRHNSGK